MTEIRFAALRAVLLLAAAAALPGCVSEGYDSVSGPRRAPQFASYFCNGGGTLKVENMGRSVKLESPRGLQVTLPASPPDSNSRYGQPPYALVLDGREALWFVTGKKPLTCRR